MRWITLLILLSVAGPVFAQGTKADYERSAALRERFSGKVRNARIEAKWWENGKGLTYEAETADGTKQTILVEFETGTKRVAGKEEKLPPATSAPSPARRGGGGGGGGGSRGATNAATSPDGRWTVSVREFNLYVRNSRGGPDTQLSFDAHAGDGYNGKIYWAPDSRSFIAIRFKPGGDRKVTLVNSVPADQTQPKTTLLPYLKPGDPIPQEFPRLFDIEKKAEIPVSVALFDNPYDIRGEHWTPDGKRFFFAYNQRGHQVMRVLSIDAKTGRVTPVVNEECKTFFNYANKFFLRYLDATDELIWMSERSGWNHLYLIDAKTGTVKQPITSGEWVIKGVEAVDAMSRRIWFRAVGVHPGQDPYHVHFGRVDFDGKNLVWLTTDDGTHEVQWSPDRKYYVDSWSRVDAEPAAVLRRSSDGAAITSLAVADITKLEAAGWKAPERFTAKGRDGKTDIWGIIHRPTNFDPKKKYPVIEYIYAGPHDHHVPKAFTPYSRRQELVELGFIMVQIDGMGTNWRSKAFHDVCWKNLGDAGFPDRIAWIKAAAKAHPEMDLSKGVGIYGGSAGGQNTLGGMLFHREFYTVGVADCGCHDNRMDKIWWNEHWMGWPIGPHYAEQSNVTNAHKLTGKLFLTVGEVDSNVDPASTMQVVSALIKANKDFDLLIVPGANHGAGESPYADRRRKDFFVRHLLGVEPRR